MENFFQRDYYKIFSGTNQTGGYDKLHLGYQSSTAEIEFKKDTTTHFHVPFFTTVQTLTSNQLIGDGAVPGPIPAMADRIFQKRSGYGNTTPWGSVSGITDGTWLCSWLYSANDSAPQWLDRYFNPGRIMYAEALSGAVSFNTYQNRDPIFYDIPSAMLLEPGVLYQYYHNGEKTAQTIVDTFAGSDKSRLKLSIENWSAVPLDDSIYKNTSLISDFKSDWSVDLQEPDVVDRNVLSFKNTDFIDARVNYDSSYNMSDEFTINFWAQSDDWTTSPSTQLVGNVNYGGYGIFYNNLKYYPFFVVPEIFYGHLFYFNQEGYNYLDKSTQPIFTNINAPDLSGSSSPVQVGINSENEVLVLDAGVINGVYKMNHLGDILATPRDSSGTPYVITGTPKLLAIDEDDGCYVATTTGRYYFDKNLTFVSLSSILYDEYASGSINSVTVTASASPLSSIRLVPGTYTASLTAITTTGIGVDAALEITVDSLSSITTVNILTQGSGYNLNDNLIISDSIFGSSTPKLTATVNAVNIGGQFVFDINGNLVQEPSCKDIKYDTYNNKWVVDDNYNLYCNDTQITSITQCTNIAIDPENNIWVLYGGNSVAKIDPISFEIISMFEIGFGEALSNKNISFIYSYDRTNDTKTWYGLIYYNTDQTLYQVTLDGIVKQSLYIPDRLNTTQSPPTLEDKHKLSYSGKGDFTGYEWKRIFNKLKYNNNPQIQFKVSAKRPIKNTPISTFTLSVPVQYFTNQTWHLITCTFKNRTMKIYVDTRLRDQLTLPGNYSNVNYTRKNDLYIGTPCGKFINLNTEVNSKALIFDGYIDNIKIYDYAIESQFLEMFFKERYIAQNLVWNLPTAPLQYVEAIDRFFKHKLPGSKSTFFKIKLSGLQITDSNTRSSVEASIKAAIQNIKPSYAELIAIEWIED